jgi:hypothetical protein
MHEAIAERNSAGGMMLVLAIGLFVEMLYNALQQRNSCGSLYINRPHCGSYRKIPDQLQTGKNGLNENRWVQNEE